MAIYTVYLDVFSADPYFRPTTKPLCKIDAGFLSWRLVRELKKISKWPMYGHDLYVTKDGVKFKAYWRDFSKRICK